MPDLGWNWQRLAYQGLRCTNPEFLGENQASCSTARPPLLATTTPPPPGWLANTTMAATSFFSALPWGSIMPSWDSLAAELSQQMVVGIVFGALVGLLVSAACPAGVWGPCIPHLIPFLSPLSSCPGQSGCPARPRLRSAFPFCPGRCWCAMQPSFSGGQGAIEGHSHNRAGQKQQPARTRFDTPVVLYRATALCVFCGQWQLAGAWLCSTPSLSQHLAAAAPMMWLPSHSSPAQHCMHACT